VSNAQLGYNYSHFNAAGTYTILSGIGATQATASNPANAGILAGVDVNIAGTSVTVYDSATGSGQIVCAFGATIGQLDLPPIQLKNGLTVVIVGSADVTVAWC
jgi:hypothetical protein